MSDFMLNDSVRVNYKQINSALLDMDEWQGRVAKIYVENKQKFVYLELDSITLKKLPESYIRECMEKEMDFEMMAIPIEYCERVEPRDLPLDVEDTVNAILSKYDSPLAALDTFLSSLAIDDDDPFENAEFDFEAFCTLIDIDTQKQKDMVERALKRGFKNYNDSEQRRLATTQYTGFMGTPYVFGFGAIEIVRDPKINEIAKLLTVGYALEQLNEDIDYGIPYGFMSLMAFLAQLGRLEAPILAFVATVLGAGSRFGRKTWVYELTKKEMTILTDWLLACDEINEDEKLWFFDYFVNSLEGLHHTGTPIVKLIFASELLSAESKKTLCEGWLADDQAIGTPPFPWQLMMAQLTGDTNQLSKLLDHSDIPPEMREVIVDVIEENHQIDSAKPDAMLKSILHQGNGFSLGWSPTYAKRLSIPMLITLGEDAYTICQEFLADDIRDFQKDAINQGVSDALKLHHAKLTEPQLREIIEQGLTVGRVPTRKTFYKTSTQFFGTEYLEKALDDQAASIKKWGAKELAKHTKQTH